MVSGGITEIIWHFVGYLKLINDIARERIDYDETASRNLNEDYTTARPDYVARPDDDELDSRGIRFPETPLTEEIRIPGLPPVKKIAPLPSPDFDPDLSFNPARLLPNPGGGGGGAGSDFHITVHYEPGGEQSIIDISQQNMLLDDDELLFMVSGRDSSYDFAAFQDSLDLVNDEADFIVQQMVDDANSEIPTQWWMEKSSNGAVDFLASHDAETATRAEPAAHSVDPGHYKNGLMQDPPPEEPPVEQPPEPDLGNLPGQWALAGGNETFNGALIVDLGESGRAMIVMGDYFKTNAIFQTNSILDEDHVTSGGGNLLEDLSADNITDNIADFIQHPGLYASSPVTFAGPRWNVEVVDGNYYNVHAIAQLNYLSDNDVIVQKSADTHYEAHSGENELGNLALIFNGTIHYDLIVVGGIYHGMNAIFQNNILLNNDVVKLITNTTVSTQSVVSGENELINTATIETYGDDNFHQANANLGGIADALASGINVLNPSYGEFLDGSGGIFDVLYVKGDYYDINAIWQTNIISDVNIILQILDPMSDFAKAIMPDGSQTQSVISGRDTLTNDAAIVDVGPTNTFVDGDVYNDTILVQANLLPENGRALVHDMKALVPELIAFVNEAEEEQVAPISALGHSVHEDPIASVMH